MVSVNMVRRRRPLSIIAGAKSLSKASVHAEPSGLTKPGDIRLYSTYAPALKADTYQIDVRQEVDGLPGIKPSVTIQNKSSDADDGQIILQHFTVQAPRFSLDPSDIHSVYPPQGHADEGRVLPHIIFKDPHLPWERSMDRCGDTNDGVNQVPWLAVLVFEPDELTVNSSVFTNGVPKQSPTMAFSMSLKDLMSTKNVATTVGAGTDIPDTSVSANAIFIKSDLFTSFYDLDATSSPATMSLDRYKYLTHVRNVNSDGCLAADPAAQNGIFSVAFSHRAGPLSQKAPTTVVVHVVSLENVCQNIGAASKMPYVALISLFSWTYQGLPPQSVDFATQMRDLGLKHTSLLRPSFDASAIQDQVLATRLLNGFSLVRHRLISGEATVAYFRGPLSPVAVPYPLLAPRSTSLKDAGAWPKESFSSMDYQILDPRTGVMDISYSVAWQIGRALALADRTFASALVNLRSDIHRSIISQAKSKFLISKHSYTTRSGSIARLKDIMDFLATDKMPLTEGGEVNFSVRWAPAQVQYADLRGLHRQMLQSVTHGKTPFADAVSDGFNIQDSPHWHIVHEGLLDRIHLINLPAHYLIAHPDNLPSESIRFFHLDRTWIDAQIDGALSLGDHISQPDMETAPGDIIDTVRQMIKDAFVVALADVPYPTGGFLIRSKVVKAFPNLMVTSGSSTTTIISSYNLNDETLLTLIHRSGDTNTAQPPPAAITISQPPHQQRFAMGEYLDASKLEFPYKKVYTENGPSGSWDATGVQDDWSPTDKSNPNLDIPEIFDWTSRTIKVHNLASRTRKVLHDSMGTAFPLDVLRSAVFALQLNDPLYQLNFMEPSTPPSALGSKDVKSKSISGSSTRPTLATRQTLPRPSPPSSTNSIPVKPSTPVAPLPPSKNPVPVKPSKPVAPPPSTPITSAEVEGKFPALDIVCTY
jgi:hypothetical protein